LVEPRKIKRSTTAALSERGYILARLAPRARPALGQARSRCRPQIHGFFGNRYAATALLFINKQEVQMGLGRGALLWLLGIPLPIIILLALFWHH
jgi:hypothetical protein